MAIPQADAGPAAVFGRFVDEAVNAGDLEVVGQLFAADAVVELPIVPPGSEGPQAVEQAVAGMRTAFPDLRVHLEDTIEDGERLWALGTVQGSNTGPLMGQAATGRPAHWPVMHRLRVRNGRIVEWRALFDRLALLQQLGLAPAPGAATADDAAAAVPTAASGE